MITKIDNALTSFEYRQLLMQIACGKFQDETNDVDGVVYPLICRSIPESVTNSIDSICHNFLGRDAKNVTEFLRASPAGVHCPNPVHHDGSMGEYSLMLYTSSQGGTAFVAHTELGVSVSCTNQLINDAIAKDSREISKWKTIEYAQAVPNRVVIFPANLMHAAAPIGGFGEGVMARTVYTRFFS